MPASSERSASPGLVIVWSGNGPCLLPLRIGTKALVLGRELLGLGGTDDRISRRHARITLTNADGAVPRFTITDLESRNGTYTGGHAMVDRETTVTSPCVIRAGRTVGVLVADVTPFEGHAVVVEPGRVVGPSTAPLYALAAASGAVAKPLVVMGELGTGKRLIADAYCRVRAGGVSSVRSPEPSLPENLPRGTSTLVIEEADQVSGPAQERLSSLLSRRRDLGVVALLGAAADVGPPAWIAARDPAQLLVPPLRLRFDELAHLVVMAVRIASPTIAVHSSLIEAALLRPWPGNVRELFAALRHAADNMPPALVAELRAEHLEAHAGYLSAALAETPVRNVTVVEAPKRRKPVRTRIE